MSDTLNKPPESPVPLGVFAASLRPRKIGSRTITPRRGKGAPRQIDVFAQGDPNEIWIRHLKIMHGNERHTPSEWQLLIDAYAQQPAHPADPRYAQEV